MTSESASFLMTTPFPQSPRRYQLEVTLVQEGVSLFHDLGMPIRTANVEIGM